MFKLRHFYILCTKLAHFKCDACYRSQNSWDGRTFTMVQHLLFYSEQFEDVWPSRLWVLVLEFGPILAWYRFPAVEEFVVVWRIFCLMMPQMFSIGERSGQQAGQCSTQTFLLQSHAVVIAAECSFALSYWNTSGSLYTFQHSYCLPKHASCPYRIHLCTPIPSEMLAFVCMASSHITLQPKTGYPLKISKVEPGQYLDGRPPGKTRLLLKRC